MTVKVFHNVLGYRVIQARYLSRAVQVCHGDAVFCMFHRPAFIRHHVPDLCHNRVRSELATFEDKDNAGKKFFACIDGCILCLLQCLFCGACSPQHLAGCIVKDFLGQFVRYACHLYHPLSQVTAGRHCQLLSMFCSNSAQSVTP